MRSAAISAAAGVAAAIAAVAAGPAAAATAATPNLPAAITYLTTTTGANGLTDGTSLAADGYYDEGTDPDFADFGLTLDGAYALAAAGTDNAVLDTVVSFIASGTDGSGRTVRSWTDTDTAADAPYVQSGAIGKEALLAEAVGDDPMSFGGQNLIGLLNGEVCTKASASGAYPACAAAGNYENSESTFDQTLAIMAQIRAGDLADADPSTGPSPVGYLESQQESSGAWPSEIPSTGDSDPDSTGMAVMALSLVPGTTAAAEVQKGLAWLASTQDVSGGWTGASGAGSTNSTALALMALRLDASAYATPLARGLAFLASQQNSDGGFNIADNPQTPVGSDVRASTQVVSGIVGTSFGTLTLAPTESTTAPADGATYQVGSVPSLAFRCTAGAGQGAALVSGAGGCSASVDGGAVLASGAALPDTVGAHTVTVTATQTNGETGTSTVTYQVAALPTPTPSPTPAPNRSPPPRHRIVPLTVTRAHESVGAWRERSLRGHRAGTTFTFRLSSPAAITLVFSRVESRRCGHRRCTRLVRVGTMTVRGRDGLNRLRFTGVIGRRRLARGTYEVVIEARGAGRRSARTRPLRFTILTTPHRR